MRRRKILFALKPFDMALPMGDIIEKLQHIQSAFKDKEELRLEFEYDDIGKPIFYVVYNHDETPVEEMQRLAFEQDFAENLKRLVARAYE